MSDYYDSKKNLVYTKANLEMLGYPTDKGQLEKLNIYPLRYVYTNYNIYTQKQIPDGNPVYEQGVYVQYFKVEDKIGEELAWGQKRQKEFENKQELEKLDSKAVRSIHANVSGTATEQDMLYLIENELTKQKIRTELGNEEYDKNYSDSLKIRMWRDYLLDSTDWLVSRYSEQPSSLTELQHNELIIYRQELRDLPNKEGFPWDGDLTKTPFPTKPDFI